MPKLNLTDVAIKRIKRPKSGPIDYWDKTLRGLGVRISPSGRRTFNIQTKVLRGGRRRDVRIKLGVFPEISLSEARELATEYKRLAADGLDPVTVRQQKRYNMERRSATTFAAVREQFFDAHLPNLRPASSREYRRVLIRTFAVWDALPLESIDADAVANILDGIKAPYAANRSRAYLAVMFRWAVGKRIIRSSPVTDIPKPAKEVSRDRVLTEAEIATLWKSTGKLGYPFGQMFKLLLLTAQRLREVAGMRWQDVDLDKAVWVLPGSLTKNKEPHTVPLSDQVVSILQTLPRVGDEYALTTTGRSPISGFGRAKERLDTTSKVTGWRWHDLRRSFATFSAEQLEIDLPVAEAILNHKSGSTAGVVGVYNRARYTRQKTEGLQAWANLVDRITGEATTDNIVPMKSK